MKVNCYLQLVPRYSRGGYLQGVSVKALSQKSPGMPLSGAHVIHLELDVPQDAFKATKVNVTIPLEKLVPQVNATLP